MHPFTIDDDSSSLLESAIDKLGISARAYNRILKIARTIADLEKEPDIKVDHISEAIQYRNLERDSVPDFLPDADFLFGQTNTKGHEAEFKFGLAQNVDFGLDYYWDVRPIKGPNTDKKETLLQVDLGMKW